MSLLVGPRKSGPPEGIADHARDAGQACSRDRPGRPLASAQELRGVNARRAARGTDAESIYAFKVCAAEQGVLRGIDRSACGEFSTFTVADVADELRPPLRALGRP